MRTDEVCQTVHVLSRRAPRSCGMAYARTTCCSFVPNGARGELARKARVAGPPKIHYSIYNVPVKPPRILCQRASAGHWALRTERRRRAVHSGEPAGAVWRSWQPLGTSRMLLLLRDSAS